jgi:hypothetical protein
MVESLWEALRVSCEADGAPQDHFPAVIMAIDEYIASGYIHSERDYRSLARVASQLELPRLDPENNSIWDKLILLKDPCLAWWLLDRSPENWLCQSLVQPDFAMLEARADILYLPVLPLHIWRESRSIEIFVRMLIIEGSPKVQSIVMDLLLMDALDQEMWEEKHVGRKLGVSGILPYIVSSTYY